MLDNLINATDKKYKSLWQLFATICEIPRPSGHEEKISEFIQNFAKELNLSISTDVVGNIFIKKPASKGLEKLKTVILQAHLDMVPQKESHVQHNFETDPICAIVEGEWVTAKGTTLGADNGIGIAAILNILQSNNLQHGPLEILFTIDEESGMTGAAGLKADDLKGDILINLDTEYEGKIFIGSAGGVNTNITITYQEDVMPKDVISYQLQVSGLKGGHSGVDIHLGRGNANKILNRLLWHADKQFDCRLSRFDGGGLSNAIARDAIATVIIPKTHQEVFENYVQQFEKIICDECVKTDPQLVIKAKRCELPQKIMNVTFQNNLLNALYCCPHGVIRMSADVPGLVETSTNLARVLSENGVTYILTSQRSSIETRLDDVAAIVRSAFEMVGGKVEHKNRYPGWKPNIHSPIIEIMKNVYQKLL